MRKGFTLIELLVVIAIIAILAAILFPVFARVRQTAYQTKCGSHGRQLGMAMMLYLEDNSGRFPSAATSDMLAQFSHITWRYHWPPWPATAAPSFHWGVSSSNDFKWIQLAKYVKNQEIWVCPAPNGQYSQKFSLGYRMSWCFVTRQYMYDPDLTRYPDTAIQTEERIGEKEGIGRTIAEIQSMDLGRWRRCVPLTKKVFCFCYALGPDVSWRTETFAGSGKCEPPLYPHNEGSVYVFFDGHARWAETGCGWAPVHYTNALIDRPHPHR